MQVNVYILSEFSLKLFSEIGSDSGLVQTKRQAIIWTNGGEFTDAYMRHLTSMSEEMVAAVMWDQ